MRPGWVGCCQRRPTLAKFVDKMVFLVHSDRGWRWVQPQDHVPPWFVVSVSRLTSLILLHDKACRAYQSVKPTKDLTRSNIVNTTTGLDVSSTRTVISPKDDDDANVPKRRWQRTFLARTDPIAEGFKRGMSYAALECNGNKETRCGGQPSHTMRKARLAAWR